MKKVIIVFLCVLGLYSCGQKRPAAIERPVFDVWNTTTLEIDKIEMSDSATVFYIDAYFWPNNWIRISKETYIRESGSDERLLISHAEGIHLGEEITMPESGTISFKLYFPPLKPGITKIDFIESDCPDCFKIWGIHLLPHAKIKIDPIPKDVSKPSAEPLPLPEFSTLSTQVSGQILGYVEGVTSSEVNIYATNIITGEEIETAFPIANDGSFNGELTPGLASIYYSSIGSLFLIPGKELKIITDLKKRSRFQSRYRTDKEPGDSIFTYLSGSCFTGTEIEVINQAPRGMINYQKLMQETVNMNPEEFKQHLIGIMNNRLDELKQNNYTPNVLLMVENAVKLSAYMLLMQYEGFINAAYKQVNNINREDMDKVTFKAEKPGAEYYSFLKGELNDNMSYFSSFLNLTRFLVSSDLFNYSREGDKPANERFAYFREKFALVAGTDKGLLFDVIQAQLYAQQLNDMKFFTEAEKQELLNVFKDKPAYAETLIAQNDKLLALIAANRENKECVAHEPPNVSQEKMFDVILSKYQGKVVMVDFWATWCGPCMQAMKTIKPLKDEMKEKDIVWLYLTGETSPLNTWMLTYPTISGEHYRVSDTQWSYWYKTFGIQGIPTYMIYDRKGKHLSRHLGFPGVDIIRNDIEKGL